MLTHISAQTTPSGTELWQQDPQNPHGITTCAERTQSGKKGKTPHPKQKHATTIDNQHRGRTNERPEANNAERTSDYKKHSGWVLHPRMP